MPQLPEETPSELSAPPSAKAYAAECDGVIWLIGIIAMLLCFLLSDQPVGFSDAASLGALIGETIISFALVFLFGLIGAKITGKVQKRSRIGFTIGACVAVAMPVIGEYRIRQYRANDVSAAGQRLVSQGREMLTTSMPPLNRLSAREAADDKVLLKAVGQFWADEKASREQYQQKLHDIAGDGIIQASKLDTPDKIGVARQKLSELAKLSSEQEQAVLAMMNGWPNRINALPISLEAKESATASMQ